MLQRRRSQSSKDRETKRQRESAKVLSKYLEEHVRLSANCLSFRFVPRYFANDYDIGYAELTEEGKAAYSEELKEGLDDHKTSQS